MIVILFEREFIVINTKQVETLLYQVLMTKELIDMLISCFIRFLLRLLSVLSDEN